MQPQTQTVVAGTNVTLSVAATGTEPFSYQWRRNGVNLAGQSNANLTHLNAQPAYSGNYDVVVSNALGSVTSAQLAGRRVRRQRGRKVLAHRRVAPDG
ncbi:MAG: immunoglobulin domain-containing protein [Verrucomicrobia bacterium]|nr:immunoglobulin domain-containing protein [Verrucomicrobiota bacterium]